MWKKRMLCLALVLCALVMTACQQQERFDTNLPQTTEAPAAPARQDLFGSGDESAVDFDDGSYDPSSEEGGDWEDVGEGTGWDPYEETDPYAEGDPYAAGNPYQGADSDTTPAPTMQSEYAGATPLVIDPIDKPTPTPLPPLNLTFNTYNASALHMSFDAPAGWVTDESNPDTFVLTNPDPSMDYQASLSIRAITVNKQYTVKELTREAKGMLDTLKSSGLYDNFSPSSTAQRSFLGTTGVYANYKAVLRENGAEIAGRFIVTCVDRMLYTLHVSYPRGYTEYYVDNVYDKFRHSVKLGVTAPAN